MQKKSGTEDAVEENQDGMPQGVFERVSQPIPITPVEDKTKDKNNALAAYCVNLNKRPWMVRLMF